MWQYIIVFALSTLLSYALAPRPRQSASAKPGELQAPNIEEGAPVPVVFGTCWVRSPILLWYGDIDVQEIRRCV